MRDRGWQRFTAWKKDKKMRQIIQRERYFASGSRTIQERKKSHVPIPTSKAAIGNSCGEH